MRPELLALFLLFTTAMQMESIVGKLAGALPLSVVFHGTSRAFADGEELTKAQVRKERRASCCSVACQPGSGMTHQ